MTQTNVADPLAEVEGEFKEHFHFRHLRCVGSDPDNQHAMCGKILFGIPAPQDVPKCPVCNEQKDQAWCKDCLEVNNRAGDQSGQ